MTTISTAEYKELYNREFQKYSKLYAANLTQQDTALLQVSVGVIAALATLGKEILFANKILGTVGLSAMALTIFCVILGYWTSNFFLVEVQRKLQENYANNDALNKDFDKIKFGRFNDNLAFLTVPSFLFGLILLFIVIVLYIFNVKWL